MTGAELTELATELGIDAIGAAPAQPVRRHGAAHSRAQERGLFADMRFTMARPEVSCHPELLLEGARTVIAAALCYYRRRAARYRADEGRLPRYTWRDEYAELRVRLDALGRRLGGTYRVLVDESDHVDRAGAVRAGVAFYGKNTMAITRRFGSWVVLGALVTDVEVEASPPLELDCGECRLCIDACPTGALDEPGTLDATKCLSYWTQAPRSIPDAYRAETRSNGLRLRHLPGGLSLEPRGREAAPGATSMGTSRMGASRSPIGSTAMEPTSSPSSNASTSRATTFAGSDATHSLPLATSGAKLLRRLWLATSAIPTRF